MRCLLFAQVLLRLFRCGAISRLAELRPLLLTFLSLLHHQALVLESFLFSGLSPRDFKHPERIDEQRAPATSSPPPRAGSSSPLPFVSPPFLRTRARSLADREGGAPSSLSSSIDLPGFPVLLQSQLFTDLPGLLDLVALLLPRYLGLSLHTECHSSKRGIGGSPDEEVLVCRSVAELFVHLVRLSCSAGWIRSFCTSRGESEELHQGCAEVAEGGARGSATYQRLASSCRTYDVDGFQKHRNAPREVCCAHSRHGEVSAIREGGKGQGKDQGEAALEASCWLLREVRRRLLSVVVRYAFLGTSERGQGARSWTRSLLRTELAT